MSRGICRGFCAPHMNHSEFWSVLESVFGSAYGRALAQNLALPTLGHHTASSLLDEGESPQTVWRALCEEMDLDEEAVFLHRQNMKKK